jgi:hypothetical protein
MQHPLLTGRDQVLKDRLLLAIQDGGARSDGSMVTRTPLGNGDTMPTVKPSLMPTTLAFDVPADGGHLEDLESFCVRAGVGCAALIEALSVPDMASLLAVEPQEVSAMCCQ